MWRKKKGRKGKKGGTATNQQPTTPHQQKDGKPRLLVRCPDPSQVNEPDTSETETIAADFLETGDLPLGDSRSPERKKGRWQSVAQQPAPGDSGRQERPVRQAAGHGGAAQYRGRAPPAERGLVGSRRRSKKKRSMGPAKCPRPRGPVNAGSVLGFARFPADTNSLALMFGHLSAVGARQGAFFFY